MAYDEDVEKYRQMQKAQYSGVAAEDGPMKQAVVGCFDVHESYPYEDYLLVQLPNRTTWGSSYGHALDFGCGPGRMIRRMSKFFNRVDGVDISPSCIEVAQRWCEGLGSNFYVNDGVVLDGVPSEMYDFVYSTIAFHHIASYPIRMSLLREFLRVLKPGGAMAIQMFYTTTARDQWPQHVSWRESKHDAQKTNGYHDVRITQENLHEVEADLIDIGFVDFDFKMAPYPPPPHPIGTSETDFIFIYARKP